MAKMIEKRPMMEGGIVKRRDISDFTEAERAEIIARREELGPVLLKLEHKLAEVNYGDAQRVKIGPKRFRAGTARDWQGGLRFFSKSTSFSKTDPIAEYQFLWLGNYYNYTAENVAQVGREVEELIRLAKIEKWHSEVQKDFILSAKCWRLPYIVQDECGNLIGKAVPFGPHVDLYACFYPDYADLRLRDGKSLGTFQYVKEDRKGLPDDICIDEEELKNGYEAFSDAVFEGYDNHHSRACAVWEGFLDFLDVAADMVRDLLDF